MELQNIIIGIVGLSAAWFFKDLIMQLIRGAKSAKLSKEIEIQKEKTDEAVARAAVSRESFLDKLRKYKVGRNSSDQ